MNREEYEIGYDAARAMMAQEVLDIAGRYKAGEAIWTITLMAKAHKKAAMARIEQRANKAREVVGFHPRSRGLPHPDGKNRAYWLVTDARD